MKCSVFKLTKESAYPDVDDSDFVMLDTLVKTLKHMPILAAYMGWGNIPRQLLRSLFPNRYFYFLKKDGKIITCGQLSTGFCNYYSVDTSDVVIGSIWTDPNFRKQGLASRSIQAAINYMVIEGWSVFYIDTQETNTGMLKSIAKIGFGQPVEFFNT
ncbi:MAG: putative GNAT family N-acyltransferase [Phenylobacterium sp.]